MKLSVFMEEMGVTAHALAQAIGVTPPTIYRYLKEGADLHLSIARAIEEATSGKVTCQDLAKEVRAKSYRTGPRKKIGKKSE